MGHPQTLETRAKISQTMKGRRKSLAMRKKLSTSRKGMIFTEEHIANIVKARLKNPTRYWLGKERTPELHRKLKEARDTPEVRRKMSLARLGKYTGSNNPNWKGGVTAENQRIRSSLEYRQWRTAVFERDNYTCQHCNQRGGKLNADHIKRFSDYPDLRVDINNGRTLCVPCHKETPTFGNKKDRKAEAMYWKQKVKELHA